MSLLQCLEGYMQYVTYFNSVEIVYLLIYSLLNREDYKNRGYEPTLSRETTSSPGTHEASEQPPYHGNSTGQYRCKTSAASPHERKTSTANPQECEARAAIQYEDKSSAASPYERRNLCSKSTRT